MKTRTGRRKRLTLTGVMAFTAMAALIALTTLTGSALPAAPAAEATADPNVVAGAQARPDTAYLGASNATCTHHVATTGSDANPGTTPATAWRTIGKALNTLSAGQTGCVHAGTYRENYNGAANHGSASAPITVKGAPGEARPVIVATADDPVFSISRGYWVVDGFEVDKNNTDDHALRISGGHHLTVRNLIIHNGRGPAGISIYGGSSDIYLDNDEVYNFHRSINGLRADAHGVAILRDVTRVLVRGSRLHHNGGDGVQCQGVNDDGTPSPSTADTSDVTLEDNRIHSNVENAIDIKSCQRVSIRGSVSPDNLGSAANNKLFSYRPTNRGTDMPGNHSGGGAIVLHYYARKILMENTRVWDACEGVGVGRQDYPPVQDLIIRRSLFFGLVGTGVGGSDCKGHGVRITNARNVDLYHNTFDGISDRAIRLGADNGGSYASDNIDLWNNLISNAAVWIDLHRPKVTNVESRRNLFWHPDGSTGHLRLDLAPIVLSGWRSATGQDSDSVHANPLFVANPTTNDYYTQSGSPARDVALNNTGARVCGAGPDIGFRESCG
jgi:hypothetical protein